MHHIPLDAEVKHNSVRNWQFRREIEELKKWAARNLPNFFPSGVLSARGGYWLIPALDLRINLETGDFYRFLFELRENSRPLGDIIELYGILKGGLSFAETVAELKGIREKGTAAFSPIVLPPPEKRETEMREILWQVCSKEAGTKRLKLSALRLYRSVGAYLSTAYPGEETRLAWRYPELFNSTAFRRLLFELAGRNEEGIIRVRPWGEGEKKMRFTIENLKDL
jgi:hypothetical protein